MRVVLFLGAGFSAGFGFPVMKNFLDAARDCERLRREERELLNELIGYARGANAFLETSPTNLEEILSLAMMAERLGIPPLADADASGALRLVLQRVLSHVKGPIAYWNQANQFSHLLGSLDPTDVLTIITTNYDLNAECSLHAMNRSASLAFEYKHIGNGARLCSDGGTPLLKLHGSLNWFEDEADEMVRVDDTLVTFLAGDSLHRTRISLPTAYMPNYQPKCPALIVPPSFLKPDLSPCLRTVWATAGRALTIADQVVFVGYSFPDSDIEMRHFLAATLAPNTSLRRIVLVDPMAGAIADRLRDRSSSFGSHFKSLLQIRPSAWDQERSIFKPA